MALKKYARAPCAALFQGTDARRLVFSVQFGEEVSMHGKATWLSKDGEERCLLSLGNDAIQARFPFGESESPQDKGTGMLNGAGVVLNFFA